MKRHFIYLATLLFICNHSYAADIVKDSDNINKNKESDLLSFIKKGKPIFDIRYLHESVNQKDIPNQANANTIRTRIGYETAKFNDVSGLIEFEDVKRVGPDAYNNTINNKTSYPTVSDPDSTVLNRLHLDYSGIDKTNIRVGRQSLIFDNQRFVGGIAWRQNDQTLDAALVRTKLIKNSEIVYARVTRVNRVFGSKSRDGSWSNNNINLINASYNVLPSVKLVGYSYLLDIPESKNLSNANYGLRSEGKYKFSDQFSSALNLEYTYQKGYKNNTDRASFHYVVAEPSLTYNNWTIKGMYESIGGNGTTAMQFSLGTNHAFNGWVDKFLTTPSNGLVDSNISLQYVFKSDINWINDLKTLVRYHKFRAEKANPVMDYGSEVDFSFEKSFKNNLTIGMQSGKYKAKGLYTDTIKVMPYISYKL